MIDIHTHILHNTDDGPASLEQSVCLVKELIKSGVGTVCLTPHFYPSKECVESFIARRDKQVDELLQALEREKIDLKVIPSAEVHIDRLMLNLNSVKELCYKGTSNILLEMSAFKDIEYNFGIIDTMMSYYNVTPIIAHVERYRFMKDTRNIKYLKSMGCIIQVDTECLLGGFLTRSLGYSLIKKELADVVASDCHNLTNRPANLEKAYSEIEKKLGKSAVKRLKENAQSVIE